MSKKSRSIQHHAILYTCLVLAAFVAILGLELFSAFHKEIERAANDTRNLSIALDQYMSAAFRKVDFGVSTIIEEAERQLAATGRLNQNGLQEFLKRRAALVPEVSGFRIADTQGALLAISEETSPPSIKFTDRDYFEYHRTHADRTFFISQPQKGKVTRSPSLFISRRINHPDGAFAGIAFGAIGLDRFEKFFSTLNMGRSGVISFWNRERILLTRYPMIEESIGKFFAPPTELAALFAQGKNEGTDWVASSVDATSRVFTYRRLEGLPLTVIVGLAEEDILANWKIRVDRGRTGPARGALRGGPADQISAVLAHDRGAEG